MRSAAAVFCLALAGCFTAGRGGDGPLAVYDLGPLDSDQAVASRVPPLAVQVQAPDWLDSAGIAYRLAYAEPGRLQEYAQARWVAPPAALMEQRLLQRGGLVPAGQGGGTCLLRIDLDEFSQIFATPQASQGVLRARLAVLDSRRHRLAEKAVTIRKTAPSQDFRGGVAALGEAVQELGVDIQRWQGELAASGRLRACER